MITTTATHVDPLIHVNAAADNFRTAKCMVHEVIGAASAQGLLQERVDLHTHSKTAIKLAIQWHNPQYLRGGIAPYRG
eukprot:2309012-Heterocapsa_arctica.AAC.1